MWTFCGLSVDKILHFAVGLTKKKKSIASPHKVHKSPWKCKKSMESMESIWNRWGSVKTSREAV